MENKMNEYEQRIFALSKENEMLKKQRDALSEFIKKLMSIKSDEIQNVYRDNFRLMDLIEEGNKL